MEASKQERLEAAGWKVGTADEFLGLSPAESEYLDVVFAVAGVLRQARERAGLTQTTAAKALGSSQSRFSKMESADPSVSLDLLVRGALSLGATRQELGAAVGGGGAPPTRARRAS